MAVTICNLAIFVVDTQFSSLIAANLATGSDSFPLSVAVAAWAACPTAYDVPPALRTWDDMVLVSVAHAQPPYDIQRILAYSENNCEHCRNLFMETSQGKLGHL